MEYKKSNYNFFVPYNNNTIVFNSFSGAIGLLNEDTYNRYLGDSLSNEEIDMLLKKGILVKNNFDELKLINTDRRIGIKNSKIKVFRIWPTSACNANCYYCFEKGILSYSMSYDTAKDLLLYIDSILKNNDSIQIEWFGGEPLLNTKIIDYLAEGLNKICKKKNCQIHSTMISNGSLIDSIILDKMVNDWKIENIQITLDGFGNYYNTTKAFSNPKYNFYSVVDSIVMLAERKINVVIRMNYDTENYKTLLELIDFLHEKLATYSTIKYYVYPVWSSTAQNLESSFKSSTIADDNLLSIFDKLVKYKMTSIRQVAKLAYKKRSCKAWNEYSFAIMPNGSIAKCCEAYTNTIGNIWDGVTDSESFSYWTNDELNLECKNCKFLPLCQGGCKASKYSDIPRCYPFISIFDELLKWYVRHLQEVSGKND